MSDCDCDYDVDPEHRWLSTNSRTIEGQDFWLNQPEQGMSYRGTTNTTFNGLECLPWNKVFSMCTTGFEDLFLSLYAEDKSKSRLSENDYKRLYATAFMSYFAPDAFGLRGGAQNLRPAFDLVHSAKNTTTYNSCAP